MRQKLLKLISSSIKTLHDDETLPTMNELQWLTHTKAYTNWKNIRSNELWYRSPSMSLDNERKGVAAAVAYHTSAKYKSFAGSQLGAGHALARALYFQCDRRQIRDDYDPDASEHVNPEEILWSLICQCLILDCETSSEINYRLMRLHEDHRRALHEALAGRSKQVLAALFNILFEAFQYLQGVDSHMIVAFDNIHMLKDSTAQNFWDNFKNFVGRWRISGLGPKLSVLMTGCSSSKLDEYLGGIPTVDNETEREGNNMPHKYPPTIKLTFIQSVFSHCTFLNGMLVELRLLMLRRAQMSGFGPMTSTSTGKLPQLQFFG